MQSVCPECNTLNPLESQYCAQCGASLAEAKVVQEVAPEPAEAKPEKKRGVGCFWAAVGFGALLLVLVVGIRACDSSTTPARTETHDATAACIVARKLVKSRLVAPATAEFPEACSQSTTDLGGGRYRVSSHVNSENRFGALLTADFVAVVNWTGGTSYELESIEIHER